MSIENLNFKPRNNKPNGVKMKFFMYVSLSLCSLAIMLAAYMYIANPYNVRSLDPRSRILGYTLFSIPAGSMQPTLNLGDQIIVETKAYHKASPKRGDIIAFEVPGNREVSYVKRVIAIGGDSIAVLQDKIYINGRLQQEDYIKISEPYPSRDFAQASVPQNHYFVLGDHRGNSGDSRYFGFVPHDHLVGKIVYIIQAGTEN